MSRIRLANCRVGLWASTGQYDVNDQPALNASCNTFRRDSWRDGTSTGIYLYLPQFGIFPPNGPIQYVWPEIRVRDERTPTHPEPFPVRNLFDDGLVNTNGPGQFVAIDNDSPTYTLNYDTFTAYYADYDLWSTANVNVNDIGFNVSSGAAIGEHNAPCWKDNYPAAGIQQRVAGPGRVQLGSAVIHPRLEQNAPNPCSDRTTAFYQLPVGTTDAYLVIRRSTDGRTVQELKLNAAARQQELDLHDYQAGVYFCTLVVNGAIVTTNRMLVK